MKDGDSIGHGPVDLAFDFGGTKIDIALAVEGPYLIERRTLETRAELGAVQAVERALGTGRELLETHAVPAPSAVGVSTMGYTHEDGVDLAPNVPGWEELRLPMTFRQAFPGPPLALDNDVRAAACAELKWGALAGVPAGLYVNFGTGVAAALVIDGRVYPGSHGLAGEVGCWMVRVSTAAPDDHATLEAGGYSTLEVEVGGAGVRHRAGTMGLAGGFAELTGSPDSVGQALVEDVLLQIAASVTNMAILFDPEKIVLGGGYTGSRDRLLGAITESLKQHAPSMPEVVIGRFGSDAGLYGAIALAEGARSAPRPLSETVRTGAEHPGVEVSGEQDGAEA